MQNVSFQGQPIYNCRKQLSNNYSATAFGQRMQFGQKGNGDQVQFSGNTNSDKPSIWGEARQRFSNFAKGWGCAKPLAWLLSPVIFPIILLAVALGRLSGGALNNISNSAQSQKPIDLSGFSKDLEPWKDFLTQFPNRQPEYRRMEAILLGQDFNNVKINTDDTALLAAYLTKFKADHTDHKIFITNIFPTEIVTKENMTVGELAYNLIKKIDKAYRSIGIDSSQKTILAINGLNNAIFATIDIVNINDEIKKTYPNLKLVFNLGQSTSASEELSKANQAILNMTAPGAKSNIRLLQLNSLSSKEVAYILNKNNDLKNILNDQYNVKLSESVLNEFVETLRVEYPQKYSLPNMMVEFDMLGAWAKRHYKESSNINLTSDDIKLFYDEMLAEIKNENDMTRFDSSKEGLLKQLEKIRLDKKATLSVKQYNEIKNQVLDLPEKFSLIAQSSGNDYEFRARRLVKLLYKMPWTSKPVNKDLNVDKIKEALRNEGLVGMDSTIDQLALEISGHLTKTEHGGKPTFINLTGHYGVGKTTIVKAIAKATGLDFEQESLNGISEPKDLNGIESYYLGATGGKITRKLENCGSNNPVFLLDEIDKTPVSVQQALVNILDPTHNKDFKDQYYGDVPIDLSKIIFITTSNDQGAILPALRSRLKTVEVPAYVPEDKLNIAKQGVLEKVRKDYGLTQEQFDLDEETLKAIIGQYSENHGGIMGYSLDAGVRSLEKVIDQLAKVTDADIKLGKTPPQYTKDNIHTYLNMFTPYVIDMVPKSEQQSPQMRKGIANVMWVTSEGVPGGYSELQIAAQPGNVSNQNSDRAGIIQGAILGDQQNASFKTAEVVTDYIRNNTHNIPGLHDYLFKGSKKLHKITMNYTQKVFPVDGPSGGGITTTNAISAITGAPVPSNFTMTGTIVPNNGKIGRIGGLREKIFYSLFRGMRDIGFPRENWSEFQRILVYDKPLLEKYVKDGARFHAFDNISEVIKYLWGGMPAFDETVIGKPDVVSEQWRANDKFQKADAKDALTDQALKAIPDQPMYVKKLS